MPAGRVLAVTLAERDDRSPLEFETLVLSERRRWAALVHKLGLKLD